MERDERVRYIPMVMVRARGFAVFLAAATACANPAETLPASDASAVADSGARDAELVRDAEPRDVGALDAGFDAGQPDAAEPDASEPDASELDGSEPDAMALDASEPDASEPDAAEPDASEPDASEPDASEPDASEPDASEPDAGTPDSGTPDSGAPDSGCAVPARVGVSSGYAGPAPVVYYTFDDDHRAGTTILDESPPAYDATPNAGAVAGLGVAGRVGQAVSFNGANALVTASPPQSNTFTGALWIRPRAWPTLERKVIFNLGNGPSAWQGWGVTIRTSGQIIGFVEGGGGVANEHLAPTNTCVNPGEWTHIAVTMDGAALRLYENGVLQTTTPTNLSTVSFGTVGLVLGYHSFFQNAYYDGDVDEVAVWNVALSEPDLAEVYFAGRDGRHFVCPQRCGDQAPPVASIPTNGLVGWYRADVGLMRNAADSVCAWCDQSAAAQHVAQSNALLRPTSQFGTDGQRTLRFPNGANLSRAGNMTIATNAGRTFAAVFRPHARTGRVGPVNQGRAGTPGTYLQIDTNTFNTVGQRFGAYVTNNAYDSNAATSTAAPAVHVMRLQTMATGTPVLTALGYWIDGTQRTLTRTPGGLGNGNIEAFNADFFRLGAGASAPIDLSEVLIFDRPLDPAERIAVEDYLRLRYGL